MKLREAIERTDALKPNIYDESIKTAWLSDLDGLVALEIHRDTEADTKYDYDQDAEQELLIPEPYSDIYVKYLSAQIDFANAEYTRYNNSAALYNAAYDAYEAFYIRSNMPAQPTSIQNY